MRISIFTICFFILILIPDRSHAELSDQSLQKIEDLNKSYKDFVVKENYQINGLLQRCSLSSPINAKCIEIYTKVNDLTYKLTGEIDSFTTLYKTIVVANECLDNQLKLDLYSAIYHARNEYSLMQLDFENICSENNQESYLMTRCKQEKKFDDEFVEITDYILNNMSSYVNLPDR